MAFPYPLNYGRFPGIVVGSRWLRPPNSRQEYFSISYRAVNRCIERCIGISQCRALYVVQTRMILSFMLPLYIVYVVSTQLKSTHMLFRQAQTSPSQSTHLEGSPFAWLLDWRIAGLKTSLFDHSVKERETGLTKSTRTWTHSSTLVT